MNRLSLVFLSALTFVGISGCQRSATSNPSSESALALEQGWVNPPQDAKPRVWWHWMNGNITEDGLMKDLAWFNRIGLGGYHCFDAGLSSPQIVDHRVTYMSDEWKQIFKDVIAKTNEYGMEMGIAGSPGWSESGGPWVKPENAMKKLVWSELDIEGGKEFKGTLPHPPTTTGLYKDMPAETTDLDGKKGDNIEYYKDIAVVAIKTPSKSISSLNPKVTSSGGKFELPKLTDGSLVGGVALPFSRSGEDAWIQYEFSSAVTIYGAETVTGSDGGVIVRMMKMNTDNSYIEYSNDGVTFTKIRPFEQKATGVSSMAFDAVTAKYWRLCVPTPASMQADATAASLAAAAGQSLSSAVGSIPVAEFNLFTAPRVDRPLEKAGFAITDDRLALWGTPQEDAIPSFDDVVILTDNMDAQGNIAWTPSEGNWKILRFGYSLTGKQNYPASPEATGLEVDKFDADAVTDYFKTYLSMYSEATDGKLGEGGISNIITDSWEAGCANWTPKMFEDFESISGYDMHAFLPALAGYTVGSAEQTDDFLWDYRKTLSELTVKNHYDLLTDLLEEYGMFRYSESHERNREYVVDGMQVKKNAAIPMAAMWTGQKGDVLTIGYSGADIRESSSVAHIYGQKYVAAESLTAGSKAWGFCPENLKTTADKLMAHGLNRFVIHESAHQPRDDYKPGLTLGIFGQWFNRHETWAEQAKVWIDYMSRSCYMLQTGRNIADILYYYGEDNNLTALFADELPSIPEGYNFDFVNADAVINDLTVNNGVVTAPSGNTYKLIVLDKNAEYMSLPVARRLLEFVKAGAVIVGDKPVASPSNSDDKAEFQSIIDQLWSGSAVTKVGKGFVYTGTIQEALDAINVTPDVLYSRPNDDTELMFVHREFDGIQIYWVDSRTKNSEDVDVTFRVNGLEPEIWDAVSGKIEKASYKMEGGKTTVKMHFDADDAFFVVFRSKTGVKEFTLPEKNIVSTSVEGPWEVAFLGGMGAPEKTTFETLSDWSQNPDKYIQYYSGTAVYTKKANISADQLTGEVILNLGNVKNLAEVSVNGQNLGTLWKTPWKMNITSAVKEGENELEIKVVNLWVNRLIGDQRKDAGQFAHVPAVYRTASEPLEPSGLIGPVQIESVK